MDLLGDLGGIMEIFFMVFGVVLFRISEFSFNVYATQTMFLANTKSKNLFINPKKLQKNNKFKT